MGVLKRDPATEPGYAEMKKNCVEREGREEEFEGFRHDESLRRPDLAPSRWKNRAYERMGLTNSIALERHRDYMARSNGAEAERLGVVAERREEVHRAELCVRDIQREFEAAFRGLPFEADRLTVLAWIESHPAMILSRPVSVDGLVELTVEDILDAPSRSAVGELQPWMNKKDDFYKEMLKRKPVLDDDDDGPTEDEIELRDPTLKDVKKMLDSIGC